MRRYCLSNRETNERVNMPLEANFADGKAASLGKTRASGQMG